MLRGLTYGDDGALLDDTGHQWRRIQDRVEPDEAEELVRAGTRFVIQGCGHAPVRGRPERFPSDVYRYMIDSRAVDPRSRSREVPTVMVGEHWRSDRDGDLLVFVEQGPYPRASDELAEDW